MFQFFLFCRFGRVQSVKLLKDKEASGIALSLTTPAHEGSQNATVAFIDIKSANKAHAAQHTVDGRVLKTNYYDSHGGAIHCDSSAAGGKTPTGPGATFAAAAAADVVVVDDRSHGPSQKSSTHKKTRRSPRYRVQIFVCDTFGMASD
jgi:hypothetical protein